MKSVPGHLKEYPKNQLSAIRLAREGDEAVQLLSSMDTQTTVIGCFISAELVLGLCYLSTLHVYK